MIPLTSTTPKVRIAFAGMGGVGGFFGGKLAGHLATHPEVEVVFLARGNNLKVIRETGLLVVDCGKELRVFPALATDHPGELGIVDYLFLSVKTYDLAAILPALLPCIGPETVVIPLQNGLDATGQVRAHLTQGTVWQGGAYIVARLTSPGRVENLGKVQGLFFGTDGPLPERAMWLGDLLKAAGIHVRVSADISRVAWDKFINVSASASATSYYDCFFGELLGNPEKRALLEKLLDEVIAVAHGNGIIFEDDIKSRVIANLEKLPVTNTASMHSDFRAGKSSTELDTLTGYVCREGQKLGVPTPAYLQVWQKLSAHN